MKNYFLRQKSGIIFCCLALSPFCYTLLARHAPAQAQRSKRLVIPLYSEDAAFTPEYVAQLNRYLRDDDIIAVRGKPVIRELVKEIKKGKIAIVRQSIADLEKDIAFMKQAGIKLDYVCYNPEAGGSSHTPREELEDVASAMKKAQSLAKNNGAGLIVVPGTANTLLWNGPEMAKYADIFAIQFQRFQLLDDSEFRKKVLELVSAVKKGNPRIPVIAQLSTNPPSGRWQKGVGKIYVSASAGDLLAKIRATEEIVDGFGFLLFEKDNGLERFQEFLKEYRYN